MVRTRRCLRSPDSTSDLVSSPRFVWKSGANDGPQMWSERAVLEVSPSYPLNAGRGLLEGDRIFGNFDHGRGVSLPVA